MWYNGKSSESNIGRPGFEIQTCHLLTCAFGQVTCSTLWPALVSPSSVFLQHSVHVTLSHIHHTVLVSSPTATLDCEFLEV